MNGGDDRAQMSEMMAVFGAVEGRQREQAPWPVMEETKVGAIIKDLLSAVRWSGSAIAASRGELPSSFSHPLCPSPSTTQARRAHLIPSAGVAIAGSRKAGLDAQQGKQTGSGRRCGRGEGEGTYHNY